jgi:HAMP domain-containing protein
MTDGITVTSGAKTGATPDAATTPRWYRRLRLSMRWKLLIAFGIGVSIVFVVVAAWIVKFSTDTANRRLLDNLRAMSTGGAQIINAQEFLALTTTDLSVVPGETYPANAGTLSGTVATADSSYPTSQTYWDHVNQIADIRRTNPEASPYTYFRSPNGTLQFIGSWSALGYPNIGTDPPIGAGYRQPISALVDDATDTYFTQGLTGTTAQPAYKDFFGKWISVYTPIVSADGTSLGGIGVDYPLSYVDEVQHRVLGVLYPTFGIAYAVLILLVLYLSHWMTRRLGRLSNATRRISDGEYDVDLTGATRAIFTDEMTELAQSFTTMAEKIEFRERSLVKQVQVLKVEIDEAKRQESVAEITESDFFTSLTAKATALRARVRDQEVADAIAMNDAPVASQTTAGTITDTLTDS